jgi:3,4-dihydroxy 2-butanone 4-phosphate synthase / GTP cyclohydrolase II
MTFPARQLVTESFAPLLVPGDQPARLPTRYGDFQALAHVEPATGLHHLALVRGEVGDGEPVLVRLHSECLTGDVFGSRRCDCGAQLDAALCRIAAAGRGVLLYLRQEGRGIGLAAKLDAYVLQDGGLDTVEANERLGFPADLRDYRIAAEMLKSIGVRKVRLLSNNPEKLAALRRCGLRLVEREPLRVPATEESRDYLETKRRKLGHLLD